MRDLAPLAPGTRLRVAGGLIAGVVQNMDVRRFAADAVPRRLDALPGAVARLALATGPADGAPGLRRLPAPDTGFARCLDPATASDFATRADRLARPGRDAGRDVLTCGGAEEVPAKLSRGEYTDDFRLPPGLQPAPGWDSKTRNDREA